MARSTVDIAKELGKKQREISVAEFFERNKQILGFDSQARAMLTCVKEGVDNALDACEEAEVLPDLHVRIEQFEGQGNEYRITVADNGPGVTKKQVPHIFGRLLYGSRFHAIRQSRGQQGIGISAAVLYGQLTTGRPAVVRTKTGPEEPAYRFELMIDTKRNRPEVVKSEVILWDVDHGTEISITLTGMYVRHRKQSIIEYLRATAVVNPHAQIVFVEPDETRTLFARATDILPEPTKEIKPHPRGIELGTLQRMLRFTKSLKLSSFLVNEFTRVTYNTSRKIYEAAGLDGDIKPYKLSIKETKRLIGAFNDVKIMAPPTDCLSPIGERLIKKGLRNVLHHEKVEFYAPPVTRDPSVYAGHPFLIEVGLVYGGNLPKDQRVELMRFANRVPLLYQQGGCVTTKTVERINWRNYGFEQRGGRGIPVGPAIFLIHVASTNVPFTSESKDAIANIDEIGSEIENALRICGRRLRTHLNKRKARKKAKKKFDIVQKILPQIATKAARVVGKEPPPLEPVITKIMNIVWIDDSIKYDRNRHRVTISVVNYTQKQQRFTLYIEVPDTLISGINPKPKRVDNHWICWQVTRLKPTSELSFHFDLIGLDEDDYDENEIYVDGINPICVIGADKWVEM